jgi:hypothetical protein
MKSDRAQLTFFCVIYGCIFASFCTVSPTKFCFVDGNIEYASCTYSLEYLKGEFYEIFNLQFCYFKVPDGATAAKFDSLGHSAAER